MKFVPNASLLAELIIASDDTIAIKDFRITINTRAIKVYSVNFGFGTNIRK